VYPPALGDPVDQEEAPAAGGGAIHGSGRRFEVGAGVHDLDANTAVLVLEAELEGPIWGRASVAHRVRDQLGHEQRDVVLDARR
jgi:hypothetical protein